MVFIEVGRLDDMLMQVLLTANHFLEWESKKNKKKIQSQLIYTLNKKKKKKILNILKQSANRYVEEMYTTPVLL